MQTRIPPSSCIYLLIVFLSVYPWRSWQLMSFSAVVCWYWFLLSPLLSVASLQVKQTIFDPDLSLLFRIGLNPLAQSFIFSTCIYALGISSSSLYSSRFSVLIYRYFPLKLKTNCGILDRELHDGAGFLWVAPHFVSRGWKCTPAQT